MSVVIDDVPVDEWSSARIRSLFGYLLTHRQPWPAREVLDGGVLARVAAQGLEEQP
jgi:hypothetical protein